VKVVLYTVDEVLPQEQGGGILSFGTSFLHVNILLLEGDKISVFLDKETGNFTSSQHRVDSFEESLKLNLGISQDESNSTTDGTSDIVQFLDVFFELNVTELFV
jgi:hypothetical protein